MKIRPSVYFPISLFKGVFLPTFFWTLYTPWSKELDLQASHFFFKNGSFTSHQLLDWIYIYGLIPAWALTILAFIGLALSFKPSYRAWRKPALHLLLTFSVGAGLIVHALLKDHWGRPRPRQVTEFGGTLPFRAYYEPNIGNRLESLKSFASGHTSLGYYFFAVAILGKVYRSRLMSRLGFGLALTLGILLSFTRIAQGGHFLSDTLASALVMWLTAWAVGYCLFSPKKKRLDLCIDRQ
ncbi:MAG: phosphatase PAP2 family protein [Parachlamydiaceae bacterium]